MTQGKVNHGSYGIAKNTLVAVHQSSVPECVGGHEHMLAYIPGMVSEARDVATYVHFEASEAADVYSLTSSA